MINPDGTLVYQTILSGDLNGNDDPTDVSTLNDNAYTVVTAIGLLSETTLDGVTITGGNASNINSPQDSPESAGAAVYVIDSSAIVLSNLIIEKNTSVDDAGGVWAASSQKPTAVTINNPIIPENSATYGRGILVKAGAHLQINDSVTENCLSSKYGGGVMMDRATVTITSTEIAGCHVSGYDGGAIFSYSSSLTVVQCLLANNSAYDDGGAIAIQSPSFSMIVNSTVIGNATTGSSTGSVGGGFYISGSVLPILMNTIVAGNSTNLASSKDIYGTCTGQYNLIGNGSALVGITNGVNGNIVGTSTTPIDPMFANSAAGIRIINDLRH